MNKVQLRILTEIGDAEESEKYSPAQIAQHSCRLREIEDSLLRAILTGELMLTRETGSTVYALLRGWDVQRMVKEDLLGESLTPANAMSRRHSCGYEVFRRLREGGFI